MRLYGFNPAMFRRGLIVAAFLAAPVVGYVATNAAFNMAMNSMHRDIARIGHQVADSMKFTVAPAMTFTVEVNRIQKADRLVVIPRQAMLEGVRPEDADHGRWIFRDALETCSFDTCARI